MFACSAARNVRYSSKARKVTRGTLQTDTLPGEKKTQIAKKTQFKQK